MPSLPYLDKHGDLVVPFDVPAKYRWWEVDYRDENGTLRLGDNQYPEIQQKYHDVFALCWSVAQFGEDEAG